MNHLKKAGLGAVIVAGALTGGAIGAALTSGVSGAESASTAPASAAPSTTAPSTSGQAPQGQAPQGQPPQGQPPQGPHQANGITESPLTGDAKAKAEAAALEAVSGGTVERSETDAEGAEYEVHMKKADGSDVTVKLDASFAVTSVEEGHR